jgi:hypothetical protein
MAQTHADVPDKAIKTLTTALKLLRIPEVVDAICADELKGPFGKGESGHMMRRVEKWAREVGRGKGTGLGLGVGVGRV